MSVLREVAKTATRQAEVRRVEQPLAVSADTRTGVHDPCNGLAAARARLQAAAIRAGFADDDPLGPVLRALSDVLGAVGAITTEHAQRLEAVQTNARDLAQTEIDRAKQEITAAESATIGRISMAIAASANAALLRRVRVFDRNTALAAASVLFAFVVLSLGGGYLYGRTAARAEIVQTGHDLSAAFRTGANGASAWLTLMMANDPTQALAECRGPALWTDKATGRRACRVPLWLDPPPPTVPDEPR